MVLITNRDVRVTAELINQTTGEVVAIWVRKAVLWWLSRNISK